MSEAKPVEKTKEAIKKAIKDPTITAYVIGFLGIIGIIILVVWYFGREEKKKK